MQVPSGTWAATGSMEEARDGAAAVLLSDGRVLVAGGEANGQPLASAELYTGGSFAPAASMHLARRGHSATVLGDGRVLVAGGETLSEGATNSAEIYDPASDSWSFAGSLSEARSGHSATRLDDGRVLIAGGSSASLEIYDPSSDSFSYAGSLSVARSGHAAAVLARWPATNNRLIDRQVIFVGGSDGENVLSSTEIYDPATGQVSAGPALPGPRTRASAVTVLGGYVYVAGGSDGAQDLSSALLISRDGDVSAAADLLAPRSGHFAVRLAGNNSVLIAGGSGGSAAEIYIPWLNQQIATGAMSAARSGAASAGAGRGLFLAAGGSGSASAELYGYATIDTDKNDYEPGQTVTITGSGWNPGETVTLVLHEDVAEPNHDDLIISVVADDAGNIHDASFAPEEHDLGVRFFLSASGDSSGHQARTTFTDARVINSASLTHNSITVSCPSGSCTIVTPLSVTSGDTITASVTVTGDGAAANSNNWQSTGWFFSTSATPPAAAADNCVDTADHSGNPFTATESFSTTAPIAAGTYYAHFRAYRDGTCSALTGAQAPSAAFTLTNAITVAAAKADQTITVTMSAPASAVFNTTFDVAATASSSLDVAITTSGVCSVQSGGSGSATIHMDSGTGVCTAHYNQAGDDDYNAAPEVTENTDADKADQTISVTMSAPTSAVFDTSFDVAATGGGSGNPVVITSSGVCSGGGNDSATIHMDSGTGVCTVHYNQAGDDNYNAAPEVTEDVDAEKANQTITVTMNAPASAVFNTTFDVAATASSGLDVAITTSGVCSVDSGGVNSATIHMDSGTGVCTVHYNQAGDDDYNAAPEVTEDVDAEKADQTITVTMSAPASAVFDTTFDVAATASSGLDVAITTSGVCSVDSGGVNSATIHMDSGTGVCTVHYNQAGDDNYNATPEVTENTDAEKADQTITVTMSAPASAVFNTTFDVAATASSSLDVAITASGVCSVQSGGSGSATIHMDSGTGVCTVHYNQAGDDNYNPAPEVTENVDAVKRSTSTSVSCAPNPLLLNGTASCAATVTDNDLGTATTPTGDVDWTHTNSGFFSAASCSLSEDSLGVASCSVDYTANAVNLHVITGTCDGDTDHFGSSGNFNLNVNFGFGGLQNPYGPPAEKSFKIKSAIPLKWQYTDANGNPVDSAAAAPVISIIGPYACGAAEAGDSIMVNDPGSSGLRYEADTKTWHFNWKTNGALYGCYNIYITSGASGQVSGPFPIKLVK